MKYIHVTNWDTHQHRDVTRNKAAAARWIKDKPSQLNDEEYLGLGLAERGLLKDIRLQYAANRGRGIIDSTANLTRLLGTRVYRSQVERLYQAGFIEFSDSKSTENRQPRLEETRREKKTLATPSREDVSSDSQSAPVQATGAGDEPDVLEQFADQMAAWEDARDADADIVLPGSSSASSAATSSSSRPRDEVWDELERLFGVALPKTSAHGARNKVARELRLYGATAELVRLAARRWTSLYPSATLTDSAIAKHWPQLTAGARQSSGVAACEGCGVGGGFHGADCPTVQEAPPGDLERFLHDEGEEEDVA